MSDQSFVSMECVYFTDADSVMMWLCTFLLIFIIECELISIGLKVFYFSKAAPG
jgi:hypothetical protein